LNSNGNLPRCEACGWYHEREDFFRCSVNQRLKAFPELYDDATWLQEQETVARQLDQERWGCAAGCRHADVRRT